MSIDAPPRSAPEAPPQVNRGDRNLNPPGLSLWELLREDLRTHDGDWTEPGFLAVAVHRFGNWRMGLRLKLLRAPMTLLYKILVRRVRVGYGIKLDYTVMLGRRVRIWHHGGIVLGAQSIGNDVHIRQNTTFGVVRRGDSPALKPVIGDRVDIGCGVCILGHVRIGDGSVIGSNAVVLSDVPPRSLVVGIPARVVKQFDAAGGAEGRS